MTEDDPSETRNEVVQENRLLEALDEDAQRAELGELLKDERMRDFIWRVLSRCHLYASVYNRNMGDMARAEGERNVGLWLLSEVAAADPFAESVMKQKANLLAQQERERSRKKKS